MIGLEGEQQRWGEMGGLEIYVVFRIGKVIVGLIMRWVIDDFQIFDLRKDGIIY